MASVDAEGTPVVAGVAPVVAGHTPVVAGNAPAVAGNAPAVAGHTPAVAGHTPVVAGQASSSWGYSVASDSAAGQTSSQEQHLENESSAKQEDSDLQANIIRDEAGWLEMVHQRYPHWPEGEMVMMSKMLKGYGMYMKESQELDQKEQGNTQEENDKMKRRLLRKHERAFESIVQNDPVALKLLGTRSPSPSSGEEMPGDSKKKVTFGPTERNRFGEPVPIERLMRFKQSIIDQGWTEVECRDTIQLR